jgi:BTB/POZ domain-containing protein KCTD9
VRKTFAETIVVLKQLGLVSKTKSLELPKAQPRYDDAAPCGFILFRTGIDDIDLSNLDMRRSFFSKSEISNCSFNGTDLTESSLCWNDFISVDFSSVNFSKSDLRASKYDEINFSGCELFGADLRHAKFDSCDFKGAAMAGVKLTKATAANLLLSTKQKNEIDWQEMDGEEPAGG